MRILYVEDNPANLFLIKRVAKMGDHEVINLIDGEEALRKIDLIKPDLILMDIQLAGQLTGLDVVRKLRSTGYTMPIVAVTAYAMVGDRERCLEAGCNEYLSKPLPIGRVVELLQLYQAGVPIPPPKSEEDRDIPILTQPYTIAEAATPAPLTPPVTTPSVTPTPDPDVPASATPSASPEPAPLKESPPSQQLDSSSLPTKIDLAVPSETPPAVLGTGTASHPSVESTSQDSSHPQDTVQAQ